MALMLKLTDSEAAEALAWPPYAKLLEMPYRELRIVLTQLDEADDERRSFVFRSLMEWWLWKAQNELRYFDDGPDLA
jgi:hypothetical protein